MPRRQMHLVAYSKTGPTARHVGGWRHPESVLDDFLKPGRYAQYARTLEDARFDGCFFADLIGIYDIYGGSYETYVENGGQISYLDPMVVLPVMAAETRHLGLGITLSTTFHNPYHFPGMIEQFCRMVVPELQRRGVFRKDYSGRTLRENLLGKELT